MMPRVFSVAVLVATSWVVACDKKPEAGASSAAPSGAPAQTSRSSATETTKKAGPEKGAFLLGRKMAFAGAFALAGAKDKAAQATTEMQNLAKTLGVNAPTGTEDADVSMSAAEIKVTHGEKAEASFRFGYYLADAWFGAELGAKVDVPLEKAEKNAALSGIPESVWKEKLAAIKAAPKSDALAALAKDVEAAF